MVADSDGAGVGGCAADDAEDDAAEGPWAEGTRRGAVGDVGVVRIWGVGRSGAGIVGSVEHVVGLVALHEPGCFEEAGQ